MLGRPEAVVLSEERACRLGYRQISHPSRSQSRVQRECSSPLAWLGHKPRHAPWMRGCCDVYGVRSSYVC
jgi:hypothetical protein